MFFSISEARYVSAARARSGALLTSPHVKAIPAKPPALFRGNEWFIMLA
jgi:hypothetical protein